MAFEQQQQAGASSDAAASSSSTSASAGASSSAPQGRGGSRESQSASAMEVDDEHDQETSTTAPGGDDTMDDDFDASNGAGPSTVPLSSIGPQTDGKSRRRPGVKRKPDLERIASGGTPFSADEINYLIYRYLHESGFTHTAYLFGNESKVFHAQIDGMQVPRGALIRILQKGIFFAEAEIFSMLKGSAEVKFEQTAGSLSLFDAARPPPKKYHPSVDPAFLVPTVKGEVKAGQQLANEKTLRNIQYIKKMVDTDGITQFSPTVQKLTRKLLSSAELHKLRLTEHDREKESKELDRRDKAIQQIPNSDRHTINGIAEIPHYTSKRPSGKQVINVPPSTSATPTTEPVATASTKPAPPPQQPAGAASCAPSTSTQQSPPQAPSQIQMASSSQQLQQSALTPQQQQMRMQAFRQQQLQQQQTQQQQMQAAALAAGGGQATPKNHVQPDASSKQQATGGPSIAFNKPQNQQAQVPVAPPPAGTPLVGGGAVPPSAAAAAALAASPMVGNFSGIPPQFLSFMNGIHTTAATSPSLALVNKNAPSNPQMEMVYQNFFSTFAKNGNISYSQLAAGLQGAGIAGVAGSQANTGPAATASTATANGSTGSTDIAKQLHLLELQSSTTARSNAFALKVDCSDSHSISWNPKNQRLLGMGFSHGSAKIYQLPLELPICHWTDAELVARCIKLSDGIDDKAANLGGLGVKRKADEITTTEWSPQGTLLATATCTGTTTIWNRNGSLVHALTGHTGTIVGAVFSPTGEKILSVGVDRKIIIWETYTGKQLQCFFVRQVIDFTWLNDEIFACASKELEIIVLKVGQDQPLRTMKRHCGEVNSIRFDQMDTKLLAAGGDDGKLVIWDIHKEAPASIFSGHESEIYTVRWAQRGRMIATTGYKQLCVFSLITNSIVFNYNHSETIFSTAFAPNGRYIAATTFEGQILVWSLETGTIVYSMAQPGTQFYEVHWDQYGDWLASSGTGITMICDLRTSIKTHEILQDDAKKVTLRH